MYFLTEIFRLLLPTEEAPAEFEDVSRQLEVRGQGEGQSLTLTSDTDYHGNRTNSAQNSGSKLGDNNSPHERQSHKDDGALKRSLNDVNGISGGKNVKQGTTEINGSLGELAKRPGERESSRSGWMSRSPAGALFVEEGGRLGDMEKFEPVTVDLDAIERQVRLNTGYVIIIENNHHRHYNSLSSSGLNI